MMGEFTGIRAAGTSLQGHMHLALWLIERVFAIIPINARVGRLPDIPSNLDEAWYA